MNESGLTNIESEPSDKILDIEGRLDAMIGFPDDKYSNSLIGDEYSNAFEPPLIVKSVSYGISNISEIAKKLGMSEFFTCPVKRIFF